MWIVQTFLLLCAGDFPTVLVSHAIAIVAGAFCALREPELLFDSWKAVRGGSPKVGFVIHVALLHFALLFMPLSAQDFVYGKHTDPARKNEHI